MKIEDVATACTLQNKIKSQESILNRLTTASYYAICCNSEIIRIYDNDLLFEVFQTLLAKRAESIIKQAKSDIEKL